MRLGLLHSPFLTPASSWGALPRALEELNQDVVVVDADDCTSPKEYARAAAAQLGGQPLVLVAHAEAGMLVPLVAARREYGWTRAAVLLDADLPGISGESWLTGLRRRAPEAAVDIARRLYAGGSWPDPTDPAWAGRDVHPRKLAQLIEPIQVPSAGRVPLGYLRTSADREAEAVAVEKFGLVLRIEVHKVAPADLPRTVAEAIGDLTSRLAGISTQAPPVG